MITQFQALILGLLQGVTELFPISSLGHSIILPGLLGWHFDQNQTDVVGFLVATHLATALVLLGIYWKDWVNIAKGMGRSFMAREISPADADAKLGWLLVVGTIPVGIIGILFEKQAKDFFISPRQAAFFLIINGLILFAAEVLRRRRATKGASQEIAKLSWGQSIGIGILETLALFPGISRTGSAMTGGLITGLDHEDALRFSFLLATPVIAAAALLELPGLFAAGGQTIAAAITGSLAAAISAYLAVKFLVRYFQTKTLVPFAIYCVAAGALSFVFIR